MYAVPLRDNAPTDSDDHLDLYYIAFPGDSLSRKIIVCITVCIEVLQVVLATYDCFRMFGRGWGNPVELDDIGLLGLSIPMLAAVCE